MALSLLNKIRSRPLVWDTITTTIFSAVGKGAGFLIPFFIAAWFGASDETDAFFYAYGIILFLSIIFAPVVESLIVPYVMELMPTPQHVGSFVGNVLGFGGLVFAIPAVVLLMLLKSILPIITNFDPQTIELVWTLLLESAPLAVLLVWTSILAGTLNAYKRFTHPALSPAFRTLVCLPIIFWGKGYLGVHAVALGYVVGEIFRFAMLYFILKRLNLFPLKISIRPDKRIFDFLKTSAYQGGGMIAVGLIPVVDKTMATWLSPSSVSILHYVDTLYLIPMTLLATGFLITILTHFSRQHQDNGIGALRNELRKALQIAFLVTLGIVIIFVAFAHPIIQIVYGRPSLSQDHLDQIRIVFLFYIPGLIPNIVGRVYSRGLLTLKITHVIMRYGIYALVTKIIGNYILMHFLGLKGIALATTLNYLFFFFYLRFHFNRATSSQVSMNNSSRNPDENHNPQYER